MIPPRHVLIFLFSIVIVAITFSGCASVKPCPKFTANALTDQRGNPWYLFDQSNIGNLAETLKGLSEGTCRLEK